MQPLPEHCHCHPALQRGQDCISPLGEHGTPLLTHSPSPLRRKSRRPADVRRHHFTQRPGFLAGKGWGTRKEGEEEPGAKATGTSSSPHEHRRGSGKRQHSPFSFNRPCVQEREATSYFPAPFTGAPVWPCPTELRWSVHPFKDAQKNLNFLLQINQCHLHHLSWTVAVADPGKPTPANRGGTAPCPAPIQEKSHLCDKLECHCPQNGHNCAPHLTVSCPQVAKHSWHRLIDKYRLKTTYSGQS